MADKRISQLVDRGTVANNDVVPIVVSGASTTNKATISSIQTFMQGNLDMGVTSVGLSMPSAFVVSNSPVTASGNISVTGAGTVSQYIRGDGSLADFPSGGGGGGSSVNYYLNGSVSQGTIGGIAYQEMNKVPILGAGTDFTIAADGYIASFITDAGDPALLQIPAGNWNFETYLQASSGGGTPSFYIELYKVNSGGTATLIASNSATPELIAFGTTTTPYFSALAVPTTSLALTDRLALRYYVTHSGRTITLHTENATLCQIITTFTTGLTALNGLTAQVQNFATGTSGTDFAISSSVSTHTFNLPDASASARGVVTTGSQTFAGAKTFTGALDIKSSVNLDNYAAGTVVPHNSGYLRLISEGKTGWAFGDELGKIEFFGSDTSGIGARNAASIRVQNTQGNGSAGNTTFCGDLLFYTSLLNSVETEKWRIRDTGVLQSNGAQTIQTGTGILTLATGAGNGNIVLSPHGTGILSVTKAATFSSSVTANSLIKSGGTSSQFLKADGSVDSSTYLTTGIAASTYLPLAGGTLTGPLNGTSASFTGKLSVTQASTDFVAEITNTASANPYGLRIKDALSGANGYPLLSVSNNAGSVEYFRVNSGTGAAAFSSSVTSNATTSVSFYSGTYVSNSLGDGSFATYSGRIRENLSYGLNIDLYDRSAATWRTPLSFNNTGGAATFSSSVSINSSAVANYDLNIYNTIPRIQLQNPTSGSTTSDGLHIYQSGSDSYILNKEAANLYLGSNNGINLTISSTGAATFSSSVGLGGSPTNRLTALTSETGTQITTIPVAKFANTGNAFSKVVIGSDNANFDGVISMDNNATLANTKLRFYIGNGSSSTAGHSNDQIVLQGNGNVGIGTASPTMSLSIRGDKQGDANEGQGQLLIDGTSVYNASNGSTLSASGAGSVIIFRGKFNTAGSFTGLAGISGSKENTTDGNYGGNLRFYTRSNGVDDQTERMRITSGGSVGIGTSSPNIYNLTNTRNLTLVNDAGYGVIAAVGSSGNGGEIDFGTSSIRHAAIASLDGSNLGFYTNGSNSGTGVTEKMRITSGGFTKASNTGTYLNSTAPYHELVTNQNAANVAIFTHTHSSDTYGPFVYFVNAAPNNSTNYFLSCGDSGLVRFTARSNGGLANFQANDTNLSDERTKKDIEPLESYWDKFKAIEIVKFKYKDQTHDDYNIGVIAQQVEAVAPEFVDVDGWDVKPKLDEEGNEIVSEEEPLKSIYTADLHHATIKVLQEAMAKIEELQEQIDSLKNQMQ